VSFRVFATADIGSQAIELLRRNGYDIEVYSHFEAPPQELIIEKVRSGVDGLITTLRDRIDEPVFAAGKDTLKVIAQDAVGFDNIDRAAANRYKVPFTHTPDVLTEATAEFAFFIMGAVSRRLWSSERLVREKQWGAWHPYLPFLGDEVTGKTVAVIGTGRIGRAFALKCVGLDMEILCVEPERPDPNFIGSVQRELDLRFEQKLSRRHARIRLVEFERALREADYVSLHVPLVRKGEGEFVTYHLMNDDTFALMKPTAFLINTSRGPVVDEAALVRTIKAGKIGGAALDVFETEPLPANSPLRDPEIADRVRLFHHFASGTKETRLSAEPGRGMAGRCVQALRDVLERRYDGNIKLVPNVVNKEAF
jgi:glyoxylate reductase